MFYVVIFWCPQGGPDRMPLTYLLSIYMLICRIPTVHCVALSEVGILSLDSPFGGSCRFSDFELIYYSCYFFFYYRLRYRCHHVLWFSRQWYLFKICFSLFGWFMVSLECISYFQFISSESVSYSLGAIIIHIFVI